MIVGVMIATSNASPDSAFLQAARGVVVEDDLRAGLFLKIRGQREHDLLEGARGQDLDLGCGTWRQRGDAQRGSEAKRSEDMQFHSVGLELTVREFCIPGGFFQNFPYQAVNLRPIPEEN